MYYIYILAGSISKTIQSAYSIFVNKIIIIVLYKYYFILHNNNVTELSS